MNMKGTVAFVNERVFNNNVLHSFKLRDDNSLYMCGYNKPPVAKGDYISFDVDQDAQNRNIVKVDTIEVRKAEVVQPGTVTPVKAGYSAYRKPFGAKDTSKDDYWKKREENDAARQKTIEYQAARNSAIAAAQVVIASGALKLPAKEADKYAVVMGLITDLTSKFNEETSVLGAVADSQATDDPMADLKSEMPEEWE